MSVAVRFYPEPLRSLAFGSIGAAYIGIGTAIDNPARMALFMNITDQALMLSFNGIDDHFVLPPNGQFVLDITANKTIDHGYFLAKGQRLYVKQIVAPPSTGSVYFTSFYGSTD